jgi:hypothetical protein
MSNLRFDLCDHLIEKMVERDLTLCELLNEDVGFFMNPNLRIKSHLLCPCIYFMYC